MNNGTILTRIGRQIGIKKRAREVNLMKERRELPGFVRASATAMRYYELLHPINWEGIPERDLERNYGCDVLQYRAFIGACLVKVNERLRSMEQLKCYLSEHWGLAWLLGFNAVRQYSILDVFYGGRVAIGLPTERHMTRMLRELPNPVLQKLLDSTVALLQANLKGRGFGETISLDTKHIVAWVKENNPRQYVEERYDKKKQPRGDPDCRLGCKKRHNQRSRGEEAPLTPQSNPIPAGKVGIGEFYWGYGSGVVATKVPGWGEIVLAELTQPFDQPDVSYFYPLMAETERRLGFRPKYGAMDAAFDAAYVHEYFTEGGGYAAVPLVERGGYRRAFNAQGIPLCAASLPMHLQNTFQDRAHLVERTMERYRCPCLPERPCPIEHKNAARKGCISTLPAGEGARIRYTLDRKSEAYQHIYDQRTAVERINSQAKALGIERPCLRNGQAIANLNTLIYVVINLRALQRILKKTAEIA